MTGLVVVVVAAVVVVVVVGSKVEDERGLVYFWFFVEKVFGVVSMYARSFTPSFNLHFFVF